MVGQKQLVMYKFTVDSAAKETKLTTLAQRWEKVSSDHRHLSRRDAVVKNERLINEALNATGQKDYSTIVDWGPGGGFISKCLSPQTVHYYDIVASHEPLLRELNSPAIPNINFHLVPDDLSTLKGSVTDPDLLIAYSVIYHMPGLEYVNKVVDFWNTEMRPKTIAIRNMFSEGASWERPTGEYYNSTNYIRGNLYNLQDFVKAFTNYELVYKQELPSKAQPVTSVKQLDCSLVLKRK